MAEWVEGVRDLRTSELSDGPSSERPPAFETGVRLHDATPERRRDILRFRQTLFSCLSRDLEGTSREGTSGYESGECFWSS
jgi:hypothetical protein